MGKLTKVSVNLSFLEPFNEEEDGADVCYMKYTKGGYFQGGKIIESHHWYTEENYSGYGDNGKPSNADQVLADDANCIVYHHYNDGWVYQFKPNNETPNRYWEVPYFSLIWP